ncbi:MAG: type II toxin-antitoxin system death-on-curing family toxin [SAR324 cluster bacterium]|nr:type II toxin-antitoxin system death-on-curing family toxin [SAR324 cluster bacterium]
MNSPIWIEKPLVLAVLSRLLVEHGGASGIRDEGLLESALDKPKNLYYYGDPDLFDLAAAYISGIVQNHPFVDGNKRIGFMVGYIFLARNGKELTADEAEAAQIIIDLASHSIGESHLKAWLIENCIRGGDVLTSKHRVPKQDGRSS